MPHVGPRSAGDGEEKEDTEESARRFVRRRKIGRASRGSERDGKQREGIVNGHEGSRHETNEYRKGRPWLSRCASRSGGKKVEESDGKKAERAKARDDAATSNDPRMRPPPSDLFLSPARCPASASSTAAEGTARREEAQGGEEKETRNVGTTTLDSYNCSFLQIPRFLPATAGFGNPWRKLQCPLGYVRRLQR